MAKFLISKANSNLPISDRSMGILKNIDKTNDLKFGGKKQILKHFKGLKIRLIFYFVRNLSRQLLYDYEYTQKPIKVFYNTVIIIIQI